MKRYDYRCESCKTTEEHVVRSMNVKVVCVQCGEHKTRLFPLPNLYGMMKTNLPYDWGLGKQFNSVKEKDDYLKKHGLVDIRGHKFKKKEPKKITMRDLKDWGVI